MNPEYIAQLEPGVWVAPWTGDPGRTVKIENAQKFKTRPAARAAITRAQKLRPGCFKDAVVLVAGKVWPHAVDCPHTGKDDESWCDCGALSGVFPRSQGTDRPQAAREE